MDLARLERILADHTQNGTLTLPPAALESPDVVALFERDYAGRDLVLAIAEQSLEGQIIRLQGTLPAGTFPLLVDPTATAPATAYFYLVAGVAQVLLDATLPQGYRFSQSFPVVADTVVDALALSAAALRLRSAAAGSEGLAPEVPRGLSAAATLGKTGPLTPMLPLLGTAPSLALAGTIGMTDGGALGKVPIFALEAPAPGGALLGPFPVDVRVRARTAYDGDPKSPRSVAPFSAEVSLATELSSGDVDVPLTMPLSAADPEGFYPSLYEFHLDGGPVSLPGGLVDLAELVGGVDLGALIPPGFSLGDAFWLTGLTFAVEADTAALSTFSIGVQLDTSWTIIPGAVSVKGVALDYAVLSPQRPTLASTSLSVTGTFGIGNVDLQVTLTLPELNFTAGIDEETPILANDLLHHFLGPDVSLPEGVDLNVYVLEVQANPRAQEYSVTAVVGDNEVWSVDLGVTTLTLQRIVIHADYAPNGLSGQVVGTISIFEKDFQVSAAKLPPPAGWEFGARLEAGQSLSLTQLISKFLPQGVELPSDVPDLGVGNIALTYATVPPTFSLEGGTAEPWVLELGGNTYAFDAFARFQRSVPVPNKPTYAGSISGNLRINNLTLGVAYDFTPTNKTITLRVAYKAATLTGVLTRAVGADTVLKVLVGDVSFGEILEFLINLAAPDTDFVLPAPWNVLNRVSLNGLSLVINFTRREVGIQYPIKLDLGFMRLELLTLTYLTRNGKGTVDLGIVGSFGDQTYPPGQPLLWDTLNQPPPVVPGQGSSFFDLYYLGMGQRVALTSTRDIKNVQQAIVALQNTVLPVKDPTRNPLAQMPGLRFSADSKWLFGAQLRLMDTLALSVVFNDPDLYGLRIGLDGQRAGTFAGLAFEILYRKVTDDVGVFHVELKLPDAMRQLEFGSVSVTLPVVVIDIYTNGNFRIDFGFPAKRDFTRSFSVQVFPFVGYGGFYFALLDGNTSERVPRITNGNFKPVIEFGLGLSIGVGKTINKGPLKAGLSLTVEAILEGVVAWFNPEDKAVKSDRYYFVQGTAAIVGRLYGEVDFAIISASVSVTAYASATLTIQSYEPILVKLSVSVSVSASVKILFVRISFSFRITLDLSFTIGSRGTPPWREATGARQPAVLGRGRPRHAPAPAAFLATRAGVRAAAEGLNWTPINVFGGAKHDLLTWVLPGFTVQGTSAADTEVEIVLSLFAPNNVREGAHLGAALLDTANADGAVPFNLLLESLLAWSIHALLGRLDGNVTDADLAKLLDELGKPETANTGFSAENLGEFLGKNFVFWLSAASTAGTAGERNATALPVLPALSFSTSTGVSRDFGTFNPVGEAYVQRLAEYFRQTQVDPEQDVAPDPLDREDGATRRAPKAFRASGGAATEAFASVIFRDAFVLLAKSAVQCAQELLARYPYVFGGDDTLGRVARRFGIKAAAIALANPTVGVDPTADISLSDLVWQAREGQTITQIAEQFGLPSTDALVDQADNRIATSLLRAGATLAVYNQDQGGVRSIAYTSRAGDSLAFIAAFFLARNAPEAGPRLQYLDWYRQTIAGLNEAVDFAAPLREGLTLVIPVGVVTEQGIAPTGQTLSYVVRKADTVVTIAATFDAVQVEPASLAAFEEQLRALNPDVDWNNLPPGTALRVPALDRVVESVDSFARVGDLLGLTAAEVGRANAADARVLTPLAEWHIPPFKPDLEGSPSLQDLAARLDLTLERLAERVAETPHLFPEATPLSLPDLPTFPIADLLDEVRRSGAANNAAAQVSRFLLHGLRPPTPTASLLGVPLQAVREGAAADSETAALYGLTGQQLAAPPAGSGIDITFRNTGAVSWVRFTARYTTHPGDTLAGLAARFGVAEATLIALIPGVVWEPLAEGTALEVPGGSDLTISLTAQQIADEAPSKTLSLQLIEGPIALPSREDVPVQHALTTGLVWQSATLPPFACTGKATGQLARTDEAADPPATAGQPGIWYFPDDLLARAQAAEGGTTPYQLMVAVEQTGAPDEPREVTCYDWACAVEVSLRRIPSDTGAGFLPNSYSMLGTDEGGRDLLLSVWKFLDPQKQREDADLFLLYAPAPGAPTGLASDAVDAGLTSMLKTNLSTVTHSGPQQPAALAAAASGDFFATLAAARDFVRLVWEVSAVGTGGFYLSYYTAAGTGLPDDLFTEVNQATLLFVVVPRAQSRKDAPDRRLYPFNNCALLGQNIDLSRMTLYAQAADGSVTAAAARMPPGAVGFRAKRRNPELEAPSAEQRTRSLYSLLSFNAVENDFFRKGNQGLPPGPVEETPGHTGGLPTPSTANADPAVWQFQQVIPAYKLALENPVPEAIALPPRRDNPYAGIRYDGAAKRLSTLDLTFAFQDVYGNRVPPDAPILDLPLTVGYTDRVVGLSSWPGVTASYLFTKGSPGAPRLDVRADLDILRYVAFPGNGLVNAVLSASSHAARFRQAFYQVYGDDAAFRIRTSVDKRSLPPTSPGYPVDRARIRRFVAASYVFLATATWQHAYEHPAAGGEDLAAIARRFATDAGALGDLNAGSAAADLFAGAVVIPHFLVAPAGFTFEQLAKAAGIEVGALAALNAGAPLHPGTDLTTKAHTHVVDRDDATPAEVAEAARALVGRIGQANAGDRTILAADKVLTFQGTSVTTGDGESLDDVVGHFAAANVQVTPAQILVANQALAGLFRKDAALRIDDRVVQEKDTLDALAAEGLGTVAELAALNTAAPPDVFVTGTPLRRPDTSVTPGGDQTLADLAARNDVTLAQLVEANGRTPLREDASVLVPDQVVWSTAPAATLHVPLQAPAGVSLDTLAGLLGLAALALAELNRALPVFAPDRQITLGGQTLKTEEGESMDGVLARFAKLGVQASLDDLVRAIAATGGMFLEEAPFTGPLVPGSDGDLDRLATDYNVDRDALVDVNRALRGFLREGAEVHIEGQHGVIHTLPVTADDTFNTLVARFRRDYGVETTPAAIAAANAKTPEIVSRSARFALPPRPLRFTVEAVKPDYPDTIFPVTVVLEETRDTERVDPAFAGVVGVTTDTSPIAARALPNVDADLALTEFALAFEEAFPPTLKVATGNRAAARIGAAPEPATVWAVRFDDEGIARFALERQSPGFFALAPLSTALESRTVRIRKYVSGVGLVSDASDKGFQAVDLDAWMTQFLAASDTFFSAPFAVPAWLIEPDHASFAKAVKAKGDVAKLLSGNVGAVVEDVAGSQAEAAEALRQQMLVRLSSAYEVSSIIQVPVAVKSPFHDALTAPRLSGKPTLALHVTTTTETIATLAVTYAVSRLTVTRMLADVADVLQAGVTVGFQGQEHEITDRDTLASLATIFGTTLEGIAYGLEVPTGAALFRPGTTLNLVSVKRAVAASSTFDALADFFNTTVERVADDNRDTPGLLATGAVVVYEGQRVEVKAGQTLADVAAEFSSAPTPAQVAAAPGVRDDAALLDRAATAHVLFASPDATLSTAKVPISDGGAFANFLLTVKSPADARRLFLDFDYALNELEHDVGAQGTIDDYQASSWLTFVLPIGADGRTPAGVDTRIGQVTVPIPLRAYPTPPSLAGQAAQTSVPGATRLEDTLLWDYAFDFERRTSDQDTLLVEVIFNEAPLPTALAAGADPFPSLAQFISVYPEMKEDLARLLSYKPGSDDPRALGAARAMAELMAGVGDVVSALVRAPTPAPAGLRFVYRVVDTRSGAELETLTLIAEEMPGEHADDWPDLAVSLGGAAFVPMDRIATGDGRAVYRYPPGTPAGQPLTLRFTYPRRGLPAVENGTASVSILRNEGLLVDRPTQRAFVYQTPPARFSNRAVPLNQFTRAFDINFGPDLRASLEALFATILGGNADGRTMKTTCYYGFQLAEPTTGRSADLLARDRAGSALAEADGWLISLLPVFLRPNTPFSATYVDELMAAIAEWQKNNPASQQGGLFVFEVAVFSALDTSMQRPLLQLTRLFYLLGSRPTARQ